MKKSYYAIIPANVRYDDNLINGAKLLYGEITALCNEKGYCWATNSYFADLYNVSNVTISTWVNQLVKSGYVTTEMNYKEGTKEILNRYIRIVNDPIKENFNTSQRKLNDPIKENLKDNNTVNNTSNNTSNSRKRVYDKSSIHFKLAERLYKKILVNNPNHKKPNLQSWANDVRLMMERDKRTKKQITYLIDWCQDNEFWMSNILSTSKLRERFDQLIIQVKSNKKKTIKAPSYEVNNIENGNDKHTEKGGDVQLFR